MLSGDTHRAENCASVVWMRDISFCDWHPKL
jgi:hypothetical protein